MGYLKLIAIGVLVTLTAYFTYDYMQGKQVQALAKQKADLEAQYQEDLREQRLLAQKAIDTERRLTTEANARADALQGRITQMLTEVKTVTTKVKTVLVREIERDPAAYSTPLPPEGYKQWLASRALLEEGSASPSDY